MGKCRWTHWCDRSFNGSPSERHTDRAEVSIPYTGMVNILYIPCDALDLISALYDLLCYSLWGNEINDAGGVAIASVLTNNTSIKELRQVFFLLILPNYILADDCCAFYSVCGAVPLALLEQLHLPKQYLPIQHWNT